MSASSPTVVLALDLISRRTDSISLLRYQSENQHRFASDVRIERVVSVNFIADEVRAALAPKPPATAIAFLSDPCSCCDQPVSRRAPFHVPSLQHPLRPITRRRPVNQRIGGPPSAPIRRSQRIKCGRTPIRSDHNACSFKPLSPSKQPAVLLSPFKILAR
jgi:hypothetical protein